MASEPRQQPDDQHLLIAIIVLLLAGLSLKQLVERLTLTLAPAGIPATAVVGIVSLIGESKLRFVSLSADPGALHTMERGVVSRRAMYLLAGSRRLATGGTAAAERALFGAHLAAERRRFEAARAVDAAAAKHGPVLGWWSERDERTTPACFAAHGSNFSALTPPAMGWPGTIHAGQCRCRSVAPWPEGDFLDGTPAHVEDLLLTPLEA